MGLTYSEIAVRLGISRQRVEQIYKQAIKKLRHPKFLKQNRELLNIMQEIEREKSHRRFISRTQICE